MNASVDVGVVVLWGFGECPDVDECRLNLHDCHVNAECINTHGGYTCHCLEGFTGDGKAACHRT